MMNASAMDINTGLIVMPINASKQNKYACPDCKEEAILCKGEIVPPYFRHKPGGECSRYTPESYEHLEAKALLKELLNKRNATIEINRKCKKCQSCFQMQIEPLEQSTEVCEEFSFTHNGYKCRADLACIQADKTIEVVFEICKTSKTLCVKRPEPWFEFDADEVRNNIKQNIYTFNCIRETFTDDIYAICNSCESSKIYFNQRGAGCGKTYESIQLIQSKQFLHKTTFIYLTKMKSARDVIRNELVEQFGRDALPGYKIDANNKNGNQYHIIVTGQNRNINVLIGTIDSFTYAIRKRNKEYDGQDMFNKIVNDICLGNMTIGPNNEVRYAGSHTRLASDCLVIIDEGQDLEKEYIDAFVKIIDRTGIDTYIIGDKLQSISLEKNLFTHLENSNSDRIVKNTGANVVKRFHNTQFMSFVNSICKYSENGLPPITGICNGNCCYKHEDDVKPYIVDYDCPNIYSGEEQDIAKYIETLKNDITEKVYEYGYLPHNFCFIFPVVNSKNRIISLLYPALQDFWVNLFANHEVYSDTLIANMQKNKNYWKNKLEHRENDTTYYQYVYWHSSEQTGTIDLTESEDSTRILSINSSKGTGCECVYLLGLSEQVLGCFTGGVKNTLVYESLLHVGLTRQKKYLRVGIIRCSDDINKRFGAVVADEHENLIPVLTDIRKHIGVNRIADDYCNEPDKNMLNMELYRAYFNSNRKNNVDWGHHVIRNSVLKMNAERYIVTNTPDDHLDQKFKTLIDSRRSEIAYVPYKEYKTYVGKLNEFISYNIHNQNKSLKLTIPIIVFAITNKGSSDYDKYRKVIQSLCNSVIDKLRTKNLKFCPIECLMYCHLMEMIQHPYELSVSMIDIYKIISYYNDAPHDHRECGCKCHEHFTKAGLLNAHADIKASVINHHNVVSRIDNIMLKLFDDIPEKGLRYKVDTRKQWQDVFVIHNRIDICTEPSTSGTMYCVKLCAQFNNMNYVNILSEIALNKVILLKQPEVKKVVYYIVTLDHHVPIPVLEEPNMNVYMAKYLKNHGAKMHEKVFKFYKYYGINCVRDVVDKMKEEYDKTLPEYIVETMEDIDKDYRKKRVSKEQMNDYNWVNEQLSDTLDYKVDAMLELLK